VQLVSASSLSHQVLGSKPSLCRISAGVRLWFGYSLPQTPLVWEPLALGLPFFYMLIHPLGQIELSCQVSHCKMFVAGNDRKNQDSRLETMLTDEPKL
jgi:hypothetical protein